MKYSFITFILVFFNAFYQSEDMVQMKLKRYNVSKDLQLKLNEVVDNLKPVDSKLIFLININSEQNDKDYFISISTTIMTDSSIRQRIVGFFYIGKVLFLIMNNAQEMFFEIYDEDMIELNIKSEKENNQVEFGLHLLEPYIDELPVWLIQYKNNEFMTIFSPY